MLFRGFLLSVLSSSRSGCDARHKKNTPRAPHQSGPVYVLSAVDAPLSSGKTTTAQAVAEACGLSYVGVGDLVKAQGLHCGWDEEHEAYILDEDKACLLLCYQQFI